MEEKQCRCTKLEKLVYKHPKWRALSSDAKREEKQKVLNEIRGEVVKKLTPKDICQHTLEVYGKTYMQYVDNPAHKDVIEPIICFMDMLPDGGRVLDVGCGTGRDAFFMSVSNENFRRNLMQRIGEDGKRTIDKFPVPKKSFKVTAIDGCPAMIAYALNQRYDLIKQGIWNDFGWPRFKASAMHDFYLEDGKKYDGVWSCTSLFTHTPRQMQTSAVVSLSKIIRPGGFLFLSYTYGKTPEAYDNLFMSSTGEIKYFSKPMPADITTLVEHYGFVLWGEEISDLFANQFFVMQH